MTKDAEPSVTQEVAQYVIRERYSGLPPEVVRLAKRCVVDGTAVMLAGSTVASARIIQGYIREVAAPGSASVVGAPLRAPASLAALANGVSGHALDYDDTQLASTPDRVYGLLTHPTTPVLAAALAVGQEVKASGRSVLEAFCTGFEVECKLAEAMDPRHYKGGHHSTGTLGVFGAMAAAAKLLGLDEGQVRHALGIAASKSAGIRVNFGTMTKPYHAGAAAENGVVAARLARLGYQANPDALDGPWGFFQVTGGGYEAQRVLGKLGNPYAMVEPGFSIKPYPCGSLAHPSMDALRDLLIEQDIQPEQIRAIRCGATSPILEALRYNEPQDGLQAKFSLNFCLGILALRRRAGLAEFTDEVVQRPEVRDMMRRVTPYPRPELDAQGLHQMRTLVEVELTDGRTLARVATLSRGMPQRPMTEEELAEKLTDCARGVLPEGRTPRVLAAAYNLDHLADINEYAELLT